MPAKQTYTATIDGQTISKTTSRIYTHAVYARCVDGTIEAVAWAGSLNNAAKALLDNCNSARIPGSIARNRWGGPQNLGIAEAAAA